MSQLISKEAAEAPEGTEVTFVSQFPAFEQVLSPADVAKNLRGEVVDKFKGTKIKFSKNLAVVRKEADGKATVNGEEVEMPFAEVVGRMEDLPGHGTRFSREAVLEEKKPTEQDVRGYIENATPRQLGLALAEERKGHNRPEIIAMYAEAALAASGPEAELDDSDLNEPEDDGDASDAS